MSHRQRGAQLQKKKQALQIRNWREEAAEREQKRQEREQQASIKEMRLLEQQEKERRRLAKRIHLSGASPERVNSRDKGSRGSSRRRTIQLDVQVPPYSPRGKLSQISPAECSPPPLARTSSRLTSRDRNRKSRAPLKSINTNSPRSRDREARAERRKQKQGRAAGKAAGRDNTQPKESKAEALTIHDMRDLHRMGGSSHTPTRSGSSKGGGDARSKPKERAKERQGDSPSNTGPLKVHSMRALLALDETGARAQRNEAAAAADQRSLAEKSRALFKGVMDEEAEVVRELIEGEPRLMQRVNAQGLSALQLAKERGKWRSSNVLEGFIAREQEASSFKESGRHTRRHAMATLF